jgi:hypothetical protein
MKTQCNSSNNSRKAAKLQHGIPERLKNYNMSFVLDKLVAERRIPSSKRNLLEREFKRFIALVGLGVHPLAMIGPYVDEVWHQFILFTRQYREFCDHTVGHFVGHQPDTLATPVPQVAGENFRSAYRRYFGRIPSIWFEGMNDETKRYYHQPVLVGKPPTSWSGWAGPE